MRALLSVSVLAAVAVGACGSQPLTRDNSGSGGTGGVVAGTGGAGPSTGGTGASTGGAGGASLCATLAAEYQTAVQAQRGCAIGGSGQCQAVAATSLSVCGSCPIPVNDATKPKAIQQAWEAAGCATLNPPPPCPLIQCPNVTAGVCIENPDDSSSSAGICAYAGATGGTGGSGATGGASGKGGTGGSAPDGGVASCSDLVQKYTAAMAAAKGCDVGAAGQCAQPVATSLAVCAGGCSDYVNDATGLNAIRMAWTAAGCGNVAVLCPLIVCLPPTSSKCVATDAGGGTCTGVYSTEPVL
jgi:hypothetical protein